MSRCRTVGGEELLAKYGSAAAVAEASLRGELDYDAYLWDAVTKMDLEAAKLRIELQRSEEVASLRAEVAELRAMLQNSETARLEETSDLARDNDALTATNANAAARIEQLEAENERLSKAFDDAHARELKLERAIDGAQRMIADVMGLLRRSFRRDDSKL